MASVDRNNPQRAASSASQYSLMEFMQRFPDDEACINYIWRTRFAPDGEHAVCPKCEVERTFKRYAIKNRGTSWTCTACGQHVHPLAGTIFHKSSTSLHLWFYAMYIMASTRCGVSAKQLERELGVTYKTAWRMFHLIRNQLMTQDDDETLSGEVEADETYIGGRKRGGRGGRGMSDKVTVFGMVERHGKVSATIIPDSSRQSLHPNIAKRVLPASMVYTDDWPPYRGLDKQGYGHQRINHSAKVYVRGDVHTQTIEGFWSLLKNGIRGAHHAVSAKHLQGYLNEYVWRYNHRDDPRSMFELLLLRSAAPLTVSI